MWYYPEDYPHRVVSRLKAYLATLDQDVTQENLANPTNPTEATRHRE